MEFLDGIAHIWTDTIDGKNEDACNLKYDCLIPLRLSVQRAMSTSFFLPAI